MSTGTGAARAGQDMLDRMTEEEMVFLSDTSEQNKGLTQMQYELGDITFEVGRTSNPKPSKKKKAKRTKARDTLYHKIEKKLFGFSHCCVILNGAPKWTKLVGDLKAGKKRKDGSNSHQSFALYDEESDIVIENRRDIVPKDNWEVMGNKWEKAMASYDVVATKISSTWMGAFPAREDNKEERYKLILDAQKERMDWNRKRAQKKLKIENEKIELEK
ncbi:putative oxidoreductase [Hordeum vulgare]|nr:putative oxidoreductase [Hordeum vulgare]